jgi:hypothetical protein
MLITLDIRGQVTAQLVLPASGSMVSPLQVMCEPPPGDWIAVCWSSSQTSGQSSALLQKCPTGPGKTL